MTALGSMSNYNEVEKLKEWNSSQCWSMNIWKDQNPIKCFQICTVSSQTLSKLDVSTKPLLHTRKESLLINNGSLVLRLSYFTTSVGRYNIEHEDLAFFPAKCCRDLEAMSARVNDALKHVRATEAGSDTT